METDDSKCFPCPCCGFLTMDEPTRGSFDICIVCGWEDDDLQFDEPDRIGGANHISLNEARANYVKFGAAKKESLKDAKPPRPDQIP